MVVGLFLMALVGKFEELYGRPLDGRKKLQKLVFLVEHWDPNKGKITRSTNLTGYVFRIDMYGPYSEGIQNDLGVLVRAGVFREVIYWYEVVPTFNGIHLDTYVDDGEPKKLHLYTLLRPRPRLDSRLEGRLEEVLRRFGYLTPIELEEHVNRMLKLTPLKKVEYWGKTVDEYIAEGLK